MRSLRALFTFLTLFCVDAQAVRDASQGMLSCAQQGGSLWTNKKASQIVFHSGARCLTKRTQTPLHTHSLLLQSSHNCLQHSPE